MSGHAVARLADGSPDHEVGTVAEGAAYLKDYAFWALVGSKMAPRLSVLLATEDVVDVEVVFDAELCVRLVTACVSEESPLCGQLRSLLQSRRPVCAELDDGRVSFMAEYQRTQVGELVERLLKRTVLKSLTFAFTPMTIEEQGDELVEVVDLKPEFTVGFNPKPLANCKGLYLPEWGWPRVSGVLAPSSPVRWTTSAV